MLQETIKNRTIFCRDNLDILQNINSNTIDLIYLDPPFNKKKVFTAPIGSSAEGASFKDYFREEDVKDEWLQTIKEDHIELYNFLNGIKNISSNKHYLYNYCYIAYMAIRLIEMQRILKDTGSLYFHCDPTMSHYIKLLMDIIFGEKNFRNEIVWNYGKWSNVSNYFQRNHDIIFFYTKTPNHIFKPIYVQKRVDTIYHTNIVKGKGQLLIYNKNEISENIIKKYKQKGYKIIYVENKGVVENDTWTYLKNKNMNILNSQSKERTGYPTQKPITLLERIINASSNKDDIILDPFCGCATTCVAAEKLNRQWIGIDVSHKAFDLVRKRLNKEVKGENENGQRDLLNYEKEVHFTTTPPKRTDQEKDHLVKKYVYVISNPAFENMYKVGIASDYQARLNSYQTSDPK